MSSATLRVLPPAGLAARLRRAGTETGSLRLVERKVVIVPAVDHQYRYLHAGHKFGLVSSGWRRFEEVAAVEEDRGLQTVLE